MYSVPFYGESSFLMYRKDLFEQAGITMPPSADLAAGRGVRPHKLKTRDMAGICLRGKPGWGEVLAPLDTVINTFGGRWFDMDWNAQLTSPEVEKAVKFYVDMVQSVRRTGRRRQADSASAPHCSAQGQAAMWYDATSAVSTVEDPQDQPTVAGKIGYAWPRSPRSPIPAGCTPGRWASR